DNQRGDISGHQAKKCDKKTWAVSKCHNGIAKWIEKVLEGNLAWKMLDNNCLLKQSTEERRIKI
ncbi:MAG: hypothetical protein IKS67_03945, partial [Victivallales bacterium]|nr:hypothetical protein [Victivallales bacterium]